MVKELGIGKFRSILNKISKKKGWQTHVMRECVKALISFLTGTLKSSSNNSEHLLSTYYGLVTVLSK